MRNLCFWALLHLSFGACTASTAPAGAWHSMSAEGAPPGSVLTGAVWTGGEMIVWGGSGLCGGTGACGEGARYDVTADHWTPLSSAGALSARYLNGAVWTGDRMLVFGGQGCGARGTAACGDGAQYDPATDRWAPISGVLAPSARGWHTMLWTGREVIVWGGEDGASTTLLGDGARYDPGHDVWAPLGGAGAPSPRRYHSAVWTGAEMIVWGGDGSAKPYRTLGDGARYDPGRDRWAPLTVAGAPSPRYGHTAVWTGSQMILWGGLGCGLDRTGDPASCGDGARYDPKSDRFQALSTQAAPSPRSGHSVVWTGSAMIVWGGASAACNGPCRDGAIYDPIADRWSPLGEAGAPEARSDHTALWTGRNMIVWGGLGGGSEVPRSDGALWAP